MFRLQGWPDITLSMLKYLYQLKNAPNSRGLYYLQAYSSETPHTEGDNSRWTIPILGRDTSDKQGKGEWFYARMSWEGVMGGQLPRGARPIPAVFQLRWNQVMCQADAADNETVARAIAIEGLNRRENEVGNLLTDINFEYTEWYSLKDRVAFEEFVRASPARPILIKGGPSNRIERPQSRRPPRGRDASPPPPQPDPTLVPPAPSVPSEPMSPTPSPPHLNIPDEQGSIGEGFLLERPSTNSLTNPVFFVAEHEISGVDDNLCALLAQTRAHEGSGRNSLGSSSWLTSPRNAPLLRTSELPPAPAVRTPPSGRPDK